MNGGQAKDLANPSQPTQNLGRLPDGFAVMRSLIVSLIVPPPLFGGGGFPAFVTCDFCFYLFIWQGFLQNERDIERRVLERGWGNIDWWP